jgi:hypothetical protein
MKNAISIIIIVLVLILAGSLLIWQDRQPQTAGPIEGEEVFCTMDALICPDGSGVGRSGPKCEFMPCQAAESYSGRLTQQGGDYFMTIPAAPDSAETMYSLPVRFSRVSNVLKDYVGKDVKVKGAFSSGNIFEVESIEIIKEVEITTGQIKIGETKTINGVRITLNKITEDSRCPIDVACIQAGKLVADVTLKSNTDQEQVSLTSDIPKAFDSFKVTIIGTVPSKMASNPTPASEVAVIFKIEEL